MFEKTIIKTAVKQPVSTRPQYKTDSGLIKLHLYQTLLGLGLGLLIKFFPDFLGKVYSQSKIRKY